ncbi:hypothetical protein Q8F55_007093 [Vanrija albida]|uniref:Amino acid permease/ SLC12A domain-containing protein n=1 Tax=Vanrija albida TaxID=181172 RepID=A0ABR3PZ48_9TREE
MTADDHPDAKAPALPPPNGDGSAGGTLKRNIGTLGIIGLGLSIVNGWVAMSSTIVIGLGQGGAPLILYGLIGTSAINGCVIATVAELAAAYPTAGGQYVWSAILAPGSRRLPFAVGWATLFEWVVIVAAVSIIAAQAVFALVQTFNPAFVIARWHVFLVFEAVNTNALLANVFVLNRLPGLGTFFLVLSNAVFLAILITVPATAPTHQPSSFVWTQWQNESGWSNRFVVAATGLVNPAFIWSGIDGAVHIAEDCLNPARTVPLALLSSIALGFVTGLAMSIALLYSVQDVAAAAASELPFLTIIVQATRSNAAGAVFMAAFLLIISIMTNSIQMASSRLIWSLARDRALPFSDSLARVSPTLRVPVLPIVASWAGVTVLGLLYIASDTVYNSIISCCIMLQNFAVSVVAVQLMLKGRRMNPARWLRLGAFGWVANGVTVAWTLFSTVMWLFPITPRPTAAEMNYSVAVLGAMALIALLDWVFYARKHFRGPSDATLQAIESESGGADAESEAGGEKGREAGRVASVPSI